MRTILLVAAILMTGCVCFKPEHYKKVAPSVQTEQVIDSIRKLKDNLNVAGDQNENVDLKLTKALTLAEKLDAVLEQLEKLYPVTADQPIK